MCQMRTRGHVLCGVTVKKETTAGHAYVIVNGGEEPLEVFVNLGKAGSEKYAVAEAIGRLISMILRMDELGTRRQRLEVVADEMRGIGGDRIASNGTRSIPDAIGKALQEVLNDTKDH